MPHRSIRYQKQLEARGDQKALSIQDGVQRVKEMVAVTPHSSKHRKKKKDFDQTIELVVHLGIDSKQADQNLRGALSLPKGIGKTRRVIAFCQPDLVEAAQAAGAVEAGVDELVERISKGWADFDVAIAHPSTMGKVGKLGRVLGPVGKMPSPKAGTVTPDVVAAVREFAAGKVEYRNDSGGNIHVVVGKSSFATEDLKVNIEAFVAHLHKLKPPSAKGQYIRRICLCGAMTPSVTLAAG